MDKILPSIIGISPGTRTIGLAVIINGELSEWRIKTYKGSWSERKLRDMIYSLTQYIQVHNALVIVLKNPDESRKSNGLERLVSEISVWAKMQNIRVGLISLTELKKHFSREKAFSKAKMIQQIALKFPELHHAYNKEQSNKNKYYMKMFEAVGLALLLNSEDKKSRSIPSPYPF